MDTSTVVRLVDDYIDDDYHTRDSCPGKVNGHKLIHIGNQIERRIFRRGRVKHLIYLEEGTRNIWYKDSNCSPGAVAMGFSTKRLANHPNAVPMEQYAKYFIDQVDDSWLARNDFQLVDIERVCRAILTEDRQVAFESATVSGATLEEIIADDKKYGMMVPKNGKYFTYRVMDWEGKWISNKQITRGVTIAWNKVEKVIDIECREALPGEYADFKIYFRRVQDDPLLTKDTLQYQFYPISNFDNPNRGVCVVNADYPWTTNGEGIPLHIFDPDHYPEPINSTAQTIDFDAVYDHEGPGHGLGLPHSPNKNTKMYGNYSGMIESIFDEEPLETIPRLHAKYPLEIMPEHQLQRWIDYYKVRQDKY